jgi:hypothetical protein
MSFPILVSHIGFIETITIPTVHQIPIFFSLYFPQDFGGYKLYKISRYKDYQDHAKKNRALEDVYSQVGVVQGGVLGNNRAVRISLA